MKIAPGPYTIHKLNKGFSNVQTICVQDVNGRNIATVYGKENGEKEATAQLFAASPMLLMLSSELIKEWERLTRHGSSFANSEAKFQIVNPLKLLIDDQPPLSWSDFHLRNPEN